MATNNENKKAPNEVKEVEFGSLSDLAKDMLKNVEENRKDFEDELLGIPGDSLKFNSTGFVTTSGGNPYNIYYDAPFGNMATTNEVVVDAPQPQIPPLDRDILMVINWGELNEANCLNAKVCTRESYFRIRDNDPHVLDNAMVDNIYSGRRLLFDEGGEVLDEVLLEDEIPIPYNITDNHDMWTGDDITELIKKYNIQQQSEIKPETKIMLTAEMIRLIRKNPKGYAEQYIRMQKGPEPERLVKINRLLQILLTEEGQFDEEFTIVESKPKSYKLKAYLDTLADLINKEQEEKDEIGNLDELRKQAYKSIDFKQSLELVMEAAEEYNDYFKYKMIKDEKTIVTRAEYEEVKTAVEAVKESPYYKARFVASGGNKMLPRKGLYMDKLGSNQSFGIIAVPDAIKRCSDYKTLDIVKVVKIPKPLSEFPKLVTALGLDLEIAVINRCATEYFKKELSNKWKLNIHFLVVDDTNNVYVFSVKPATLNKWDKKLNEELEKVAYHIDNNSYKLPWEFHNISMSI